MKKFFRKKFLKKSRFTVFCFLAACGVLLGASGVMYEVITDRLLVSVSREAQIAPICRAMPGDNKIGLSFDVAWGDDQTEDILELLSIYQVQATFFVTNTWMEEYPELTKAISDGGHELALHSATHPYFSDLSREGMKKELRENIHMMEQLTGQQGKFFRPPYGDYNNNTLAAAADMGLITVCWAVDGGDWQNISSRKIVKNVLEQTRPGDIVMLQNNNKQTVIALKEILNLWQQQNYRPVPLGSLLLTEDFFVDYDGTQKGQKK